jgi:6-phosphogluconolactonase
MAESGNADVRVFPDLPKASQALAERLIETAKDVLTTKDTFSMVLSGGKTPCFLYRLLARGYSGKISWEKVHLFWGDERCVAMDSRDSNFAMASEAMISKVQVPTENIHRIPAEIMPPEKAAETYERMLQEYFKTEEGESFLFDAMILGVGEDGHTASLFPGSSALNEKSRWVLAVNAPPSFSPQKRITMTFPLINRSRSIFFLVSGTKKREVVREILKQQETARRLYPAALIHPLGSIAWYIDREILNDKLKERNI